MNEPKKITQKSAEISKSTRLLGNDLFKKNRHSAREHRSILHYYSKSIAYAPPDSEELAYGYSNRSILLGHLKMYQSSIIDINRAMAITTSDVLKIKLRCRKIACMKLIDKSIAPSMISKIRDAIEALNVDSKIKLHLESLLEYAVNQHGDKNIKLHEKVDLPSIQTNTDLPATSTSIHMKYSKDYGRHYLAAKDILPGEILIIEQGYATVPKNEQFYIACSLCMNIAWNGVPCKDCPCVIYCSEKCREAAWKSSHDLECPILMMIFPVLSSHNIVFILRLLIKGLKEDSNRSFDYLLKEFLLAKKTPDGRKMGFKNNTLCSDSIRSIFSLKDYFELYEKSIDPTLQEGLSILNANFEKLFYSSEYCTYLREFGIYTFEDFIMKIFCLTRINSHEYHINNNCFCPENCDSHEQDCLAFLGYTIGACSSLVNHSCVPNTARMFKDGKIILYADRPISKDEQIYESYGPLSISSETQRREYLEFHYFFQCNCIACQTQCDTTLCNVQINMLSYFGSNLLSKMDNIVENRVNNRQPYSKKDMNDIIIEFNFKLKKYYEENSLNKSISMWQLTSNFSILFYEIYYDTCVYMPEDPKKKLEKTFF